MQPIMLLAWEIVMFIAIAAAILSTTAAQPDATTPAAPSAAAQSPSTAPRKYNPRVCMVERTTSARMPARECKLLGQWRTDGIDPLPGR